MPDPTSTPPRGVHWWTSATFILLGLLTLLAIGVQSFSGQLLMEDRYWSELLDSVSNDHARQVQAGRAAELPHTGLVRSWYVPAGQGTLPGIPDHLAGKPPGVYSSEASMVNHARFAGEAETRSYHALVRDLPSGRLVTLVDIEPLEQQQNRYARLSVWWVLAFAGVIGGFIVWLRANLVKPVRDLSARMQALDPSDSTARLPTDYKREEIQVIAHASNAHLERVASFIQRERSLLDQASHEFRTPIAVIAGAVDVLHQQSLPPAATSVVARIEHAVEDLSETMEALLYLAREPTPEAGHADVTVLHDLLPRLAHDHEHLLLGKPARLQLGEVEPTFVAAPEAMVRIAVSNLLRNAIENTAQGTVTLSLRDGVLWVTDSGSGFNPVEAARRYRDMLRQSAPIRGQGLGLFLIGRICERFGWTLDLASDENGSRASLDMRASRIDIP